MNRRDRRIERLAGRIERDTLEMAELLAFRNFEDRMDGISLTIRDIRARIDSLHAEITGGDS